MANLINTSERLNIPETLESIRMEKRLSKSDFAKTCGISPSFYSEILHKDKSLNLDTLEKICIRLEIPIDIFIFKALNENTIEDDNNRKLIREIRPLMNKITELLYSEKTSEEFRKNATDNLLESAFN
ncbi:helix-turn-helix domain-containing protein [Psychroserpens sp. S379A]|uniref:helix-turn-helix domain-containing protein n=1 Tax=Psychroserpens sp. S379A TaxID=3415137 RepID=UPI003C79A635